MFLLVFLLGKSRVGLLLLFSFLSFPRFFLSFEFCRFFAPVVFFFFYPTLLSFEFCRFLPLFALLWRVVVWVGRAQRFKPNPHFFFNLLSATCAEGMVAESKLYFGVMTDMGFDSSHHVFQCMLDMFIKVSTSFKREGAQGRDWGMGYSSTVCVRPVSYQFPIGHAFSET